MTNYRETSAYDLSLFEPQVVEPRRVQAPSQKKRPQEKKAVKKTTVNKSAAKKVQKKTNNVKPNAPEYTYTRANQSVKRASEAMDNYQTTVARRTEKTALSANVKKSVFAVGVLFLLVVVKLFMVAECDRLDAKITYLENQVSIAEGETVRLNAELNSLIDTEKVIEYAETKLGMVKAESYQITYIDLSEGDEIVVSGDKEVTKKGALGSEIKELFAYIF